MADGFSDVLGAAICHDFCHPGLTNDYLIKTRSQTALIYNVRPACTSSTCAAHQGCEVGVTLLLTISARPGWMFS